MHIENDFRVTLSQREAIALKMILGSLSDNNKMAAGLTSLDIEKMTELYNALPDKEE